MPTLSGLRRRGYTPASIIDFVVRAGMAKADSLVDIELLEHCIREELNTSAPRRVAVMSPVELVIENYPADRTEIFELPNNPQDPSAGTRGMVFSRRLYIDRTDFEIIPPPKYQRLCPGAEVRLMGAYIVKYLSHECDKDGNVNKIICVADLESRNGPPSDGRKVKGTIHWLSADSAVKRRIRVFDRLFTLKSPNDLPEGKTFEDFVNTDSVREYDAFVEPLLEGVASGEKLQFVRCGYFCPDSRYPGVFNQIVSLKDSYKAENV